MATGFILGDKCVKSGGGGTSIALNVVDESVVSADLVFIVVGVSAVDVSSVEIAPITRSSWGPRPLDDAFEVYPYQ